MQLLAFILKICLFFQACDTEEELPTYDPSCAKMALGASDGQSLTLTNHPSYNEAISKIKERLPERFDIQPLEQSSSFYQNGQGNLNFHVSYQGKNLCNYYISATTLKDKLILQNIPKDLIINPDLIEPEAFASIDKNIDRLQKILELEGQPKNLIQDECYIIDQNQLFAAIQSKFTINQLPYQGIHNDQQVFEAHPGYLDATGHIGIWKSGLTSSIETVDGMSDLSLCTASIRTETDGFQKAIKPDHSFIFSDSDPRKEEANIFYHAWAHTKYIESIAYDGKWRGPQITLLLDNSSGPNMAIYLPAKAGVLPLIKLGPGDNTSLQNLRRDPDVIKHETSHHIVVERLTTLSNFSLVAHEGLADTFVFLATANKCLGESICPPGGRVCVEQNCLRTADNDINDDQPETIPRLGHQQGQLISKIAMELAGVMGSYSAAARLIYIGVKKYMPPRLNSWPDLAHILFSAAADENAIPPCEIQNLFQRHGLADNLAAAGIDCSTYEAASLY